MLQFARDNVRDIIYAIEIRAFGFVNIQSLDYGQCFTIFSGMEAHLGAKYKDEGSICNLEIA